MSVCESPTEYDDVCGRVIYYSHVGLYPFNFFKFLGERFGISSEKGYWESNSKYTTPIEYFK